MLEIKMQLKDPLRLALDLLYRFSDFAKILMTLKNKEPKTRILFKSTIAFYLLIFIANKQTNLRYPSKLKNIF